MKETLMQYSMWVNGIFKIIEAKTETEAFKKACNLYGINKFQDFKRYYPKKKWHE